MAVLSTNTLLREPSFFAKWLANLLPKQPNPAPLPKTISDRLARDAGIDPAELELLRFEWPSQTHRM